MTWNVDAGEPADNIIEARLRAKYYGAQVITYRHFIIEILNLNYTGKAVTNSGEEMDTGYKPNVDVPAVGPKEEIKPLALEYSRKCLQALIHSTKAFYGLREGRLIVTNIWGTAHA